MSNRFRIIAGEWRSRQVSFSDAPSLRPTPGRVRETLFNWLRDDVEGAVCLDLFSGSGALGFEAASRGASSVIQVDNNPKVIKALRSAKETLQADHVDVVQADVIDWLQSGRDKAVDIVFLDPPFNSNLVLPTCSSLVETGWLSEGAKVYVETESGFPLEQVEMFPAGWEQLKCKKAGEVKYALFQVE